jgi:hypothetical protein
VADDRDFILRSVGDPQFLADCAEGRDRRHQLAPDPRRDGQESRKGPRPHRLPRRPHPARHGNCDQSHDLDFRRSAKSVSRKHP